MAMKASAIGIQAPCTLDWSKMTPAEGGRFCGDCKKVVRDISKMKEADARALVAKERYEGLCVRMLVDRDGNVFFGGDKLISASLLSKAKRAAMAAAAIALPLASNACTAITEPLGFTSQEEQTNPEDLTPMMGGAMPDDRPVVEVDAGPDAASDAQSDAAAKGDASDMDAADIDAADAGPDVKIY